MNNKKAFSFIELIISVSIIILLSVIAVTYMNNSKQKTNNTKSISNIAILKNAIESYKSSENNSLPEPKGNKNYFKIDSSYGHYEDSDNFGVYGSITETTIPKKYLEITPLDPVSNHYYSYGKTLDNSYYEVAGVLREQEQAKTKLDGTYPGEYGPISLIREYNGGVFVSDGSSIHLPYNPDEHILTATDQDGKVYYPGSKIENAPKAITLYFSDGSVSTLATGSTLNFSELKYKNKENNLLTSIKLFLSSGELITKATALNPDGSDFEVYTADTTAAVRGTIFSISYDPNRTPKTKIAVYKGEVDIQEHINTPEQLNPIDNNSTILQIKENKENTNFSNTQNIQEIIKNKLNNFQKKFKLKNIPKGKPLSTIQYLASQITSGVSYKQAVAEVKKKEIKGEDIITDDLPISINNSINSNSNPITSDSGTILSSLTTDTSDQSTITYCPSYEENQNGGDENCECQDSESLFEMNGKRYCEPKLDGMELYAFAPYRENFKHCNSVVENENSQENNNTFKNILYKIYSKDNLITETNMGNQNTDWHNWTEYCQYNTLLLDNVGAPDYLKYSNLDLGDKFAIEMSVFFPNSNPNSNPLGTRYLFQLGNLKLYANNDGKLNLKVKNNKITTENSIYDGDFHIITAIKNGSNYQLLIDGEEKGTFTSNNSVGTDLYIGSNDDKEKQLNSTIDYVKIYKKEP